MGRTQDSCPSPSPLSRRLAALAVFLVAAASTCALAGSARAADGAGDDEDRPVAELAGCGGMCVCYSGDGRLILTGGEGGARVWDAKTFKPVTEPMRLGGLVWSARFSADAKRVVAAGQGGARVWDAATGRPISPPLAAVGERGRTKVAAFSPDGAKVVTADGEEGAHVWDAVTGKQLLSLKHASAVLSAGFSPDGTKVLTVDWGSSIVDDPGAAAHLWDADSGRELLPPLRPPTEEGKKLFVSEAAAAWSPNGKLAAVGIGRTLCGWDVAAGKRLFEAMSPGFEVESVAFDAAGRRFVAAGGEGVRVYDAATGKVASRRLSDGACDMWRASFSPDGRLVVTAGNAGNSAVWDVATGKRLVQLGLHCTFGRDAAFSPDGRSVALAGSKAEDPPTGRGEQPGATFIWGVPHAEEQRENRN